MPAMKDLKCALMKMTARPASRADVLHDAELTALRHATRSDFEAIRPRVRDEEAYERLMLIIDESVRARESNAQLKDRLARSGENVVSIAKLLYKLFV